MFLCGALEGSAIRIGAGVGPVQGGQFDRDVVKTLLRPLACDLQIAVKCLHALLDGGPNLVEANPQSVSSS